MNHLIGMLQPSAGRHSGLPDGFMVNGSSSLKSLAHFYGLKPPASGPSLTVADYLASTCRGRPRIGDRAVWERVQLVVQEMEDQTISKVRLALVPLRDRRSPLAEQGRDVRAGSGRDAKERRSPEGRTAE